MAKITLADGMVIEGTAEELLELARAFGEVAEAVEKEIPKDFDLRTKDEAMETTEAPREGDYVVLEKDGFNATAGKPYKVTEVEFIDDSFAIIDDVGDERWFDSDGEESPYKLYRPIEGDPQVGDKILVVDAMHANGDYGNGDILTVTDYYFRGTVGKYVVDVDGDGPYLYREEFVIIERAGEEAPQETIEEGDVVRVIGETYYGDLPEGTIAIVSYFDDYKISKLARIVIETEDDIDRTSAENLELVAKRADRKDLAE